MKNRLSDLHNHLFMQLERLNDESLKGEDLRAELDRAKAISAVASQIVSNGHLVLKAQQAMEMSGSQNDYPVMFLGGQEGKANGTKKALT